MIKTKLGAFLLAVGISVLSVIAGLILSEDSPLAYLNVPFKMTSRDIVPGQIVGYRVTRCNYLGRPITYTIHQNLESLDSDRSVILNDVRVTLSPGCHRDVDLFSVVPEDTPPGTYRLVGRTEVSGLMRTHFVGWRTATFVVFSPAPAPIAHL